MPPYPKIELHVHLEATVKPQLLLEIARRNGEQLPADTVEGIRALYEFRDFDHFIQVWLLVTNALRHADDYRQVVVDYALEAKRHGAVYVEGIFSPIERIWLGVDWDEIFTGYCDGAAEAKEVTGVEVQLTPDITRGASLEDAATMARYAGKYRDRGIVGVGLGGDEALYPPETYSPAFRIAADYGLAAVPHAGEVAGPASIWGAIKSLDAKRIRHGIRAVEDQAVMAEIRDRGIVLDVCPTSNVLLKAVPSLAAHPLRRLVDFGIPCTINTDDPEMFDTDLTREYEQATSFFGIAPQTFYEAGIKGALCDDETKVRLTAIGETYSWPYATNSVVTVDGGVAEPAGDEPSVHRKRNDEGDHER
jgi:aminodeoxyfutalosine deaminase